MCGSGAAASAAHRKRRCAEVVQPPRLHPNGVLSQPIQEQKTIHHCSDTVFGVAYQEPFHPEVFYASNYSNRRETFLVRDTEDSNTLNFENAKEEG